MRILSLFILGFLCACQGPTESNYVRNVKSWVGRTPEELITQWGTPTQVLNNGNEQFYIYTVTKEIPLPETQDQGGNGQLNYISPIQGTSAYQTDLFCQTTFVVRNDRIIDWDFEGNACKAY